LEGGQSAGSSLGSGIDLGQGFTHEEEQRFLIEEELKKYKGDLGDDYDLVLDFARRFALRWEAGFINVFYEGRPLETIEDSAFPQTLHYFVKALLYEKGLTNKLKDVDRATKVLGKVLFDIKRTLRDRELWAFMVKVKLMPFEERLQYMIDKLPSIVEKVVECSLEHEEDADFKGLKTADKAKVVCEVLEWAFKFVRVEPHEPAKRTDYYVLDDTTRTLYLMENVVELVYGSLAKKGLTTRGLKGEIEDACKATKNVITWDQVDPWDKLNLHYGVLDLKVLRLTECQGYCFRYRPLRVSITQEEIDEIKKGRYDVKENEFYKTFRPHFDDENWGYLEDAVGCILAPFSLRHLTIIKGETGVGKSTLLDNLTRPISPIVGRVSLRAITGFGGKYPFGLEGLIGKQLNVYMEKGARVLRNVDIINNLVGGKDYIEVHRKGLPPTVIRSLKTMIFAMNDLPVVQEYGGGDMEAFLNRLSIVTMRRPENFDPRPEVNIDQNETFKFMLWCRCRLEERSWAVRKMDEEKMLELFMKASNPVLQFLESDWVIVDASAKVEGTKLYEAYIAWAREQGTKPIGRDDFYSIVASKFYKRREGGRVWFRGVMINPTRAKEGQSMLENPS
jgi:hypothetical protein